MFERTNQSILTPHYSALIARDDDADDAGEVFTLVRRDHELTGAVATSGDENDTRPLHSSENLSKRKLKAGMSRKAQLKMHAGPEKIVFDEEGLVREFYQAGKEAESGMGAEERRQEYVSGEKERMRIADRVDKEVARERKRERKRRRKDREAEVSVARFGAHVELTTEQVQESGVNSHDGRTAMIGLQGDEGWETGYGDEADLSVSEEETPVKTKKMRTSVGRRVETDLADQETLALKLLRGD